MIFGIGADVTETATISPMVARGRPYLDAVFTAREIEYCQGKARKCEHYAARYAAKCAALKALNTGQHDGLALCDIEVIDDERGGPRLFVHGKVKQLFEQHQISRASVSLSHTPHTAIAVIILED